jgi:hypothetical protein
MWPAITERDNLVVVLDILGVSQGLLPHVRQARGLPSFLASLAEDGEQDGSQDRDYRDHHEQLNQGEADTKSDSLIG